MSKSGKRAIVSESGGSLNHLSVVIHGLCAVHEGGRHPFFSMTNLLAFP